MCPYKWTEPSMWATVTLFDRRDTRPPHRAQNFVWQYEQRWPQPSANLVLWHIPQVGASLFRSWTGLVSSPIFLTWSLYDSNCWCNFLQEDRKDVRERETSLKIQFVLDLLICCLFVQAHFPGLSFKTYNTGLRTRYMTLFHPKSCFTLNV